MNKKMKSFYEPEMFDTHKYIKSLIHKGLTEPVAEGIVDLISRGKENDLSKLATKEQLDFVKQDIALMKQDIVRLRQDVDKCATKEQLESHMELIKKDMGAIKTQVEYTYSVVKWMIPLFVTTILAIVGSVFGVLAGAIFNYFK